MLLIFESNFKYNFLKNRLIIISEALIFAALSTNHLIYYRIYYRVYSIFLFSKILYYILHNIILNNKSK